MVRENADANSDTRIAHKFCRITLASYYNNVDNPKAHFATQWLTAGPGSNSLMRPVIQ